MQYKKLLTNTTPGLSDQQSAIWFALAERGAMHISDIAACTKLHRPAVYKNLAILIKIDLIDIVKKPGRKHYMTTSVRKLEAHRAAHDSMFARRIKTLGVREASAAPTDIRIFHGRKIEEVWKMLAELPKGSIFYRYDAYAPTISPGKFIPKEYLENISKHGLERFVITNQSLRKAQYKKRIECASKMLPGSFDSFQQGISQFIFGNKIAFIDFTTETAYVIENSAFANYQLRLFQYLYHFLNE